MTDIWTPLSRERALKEIVHTIAKRGTCSRLRVGALIHLDGRILSTGYNGAPVGMTHCFHRMGSEAPCTTAVHAEANAIVWAARHGLAVENTELVSTHSPCLGCANLIINAGISRVVYYDKYRDIEPLELLTRAGVVVVRG